MMDILEQPISQPQTPTTKTDEKQKRLVVVFSIEKEYYAFPIEDVREIVDRIKITPVPNSQDYILGVINLRGKIIPVLDLEKKFHLTYSKEDHSRYFLVVEDANKSLFAIQVDTVKEVLGVADTAIQSAPQAVTAKIDGAYIQGIIVMNNDVLLLLDVKKIISLESLSSNTKTLTPREEVT